MELVTEKTLATGESLSIFHWQSPEKMEQRYIDYIVSSFAQLGETQNYFAGGWISYILSTVSGSEYPGIKDHWFIAEVDGVPAARLWFAYSPRTGKGNFGNVATEPAYRKRGLLGELMKAYKKVVDECDEIKMLSCITGKDYAADCYRKYGFETTDGSRTGIMSYCRCGTFKEVSAAAFAGNRIVRVRSGLREDQFDIDKFLLFQDELRIRSCHQFCGYATWFAEFRVIYQEVVAGHGVVMVAENESGTIVGYAYALNVNCTPFFNFVCHPAYINDSEQLLRKTAESFREKYNTDAHFLCELGDAEKIAAVERAGARPGPILPGYMRKSDGYRDVRDFLF